MIETMGYKLMAYLTLYRLPDISTSLKDLYRDAAYDLQVALLEQRKDDGFFASTQVA